jgi:tRNA-dihydrouridine synthase
LTPPLEARPRLVVLDGFTTNPGDLSWEPLERLGQLSVHNRTPPELVAERLAGADVAFTNKTRLTAADLAAAPQLRGIGMLATGHDVVDLAKKFEDYGAEAIIYTDIGRDGMLGGINVDATLRLAQAMKIPVIASGGLASVMEIKALKAIESEGVVGVIAGRAIYDGTLDFAKALVEAEQ